MTTTQSFPDLRQDTIFFDRTEELYQLVKNLQRGRHTLIIGEKGIGKSRLMLEAKWLLTGRIKRIEFSSALIARLHGHLGIRLQSDQYKILYIEHSSPMGDCLKEMTEGLFYNRDLPVELAENAPSDWPSAKKALSGLGNLKVQSLIFEGISRSTKPYLLFFDSLDRISPTQQKFIETLLNLTVVCAAVMQVKENVVFKRIWASFTRIKLEPLPETVCAQIIDHFVDRYHLHVIDPELYRREILKASNGNPFHIKNMLWHGKQERFVSGEEIRKIRQVDEGNYFNMGPIYIFGVAIFTLFKIFSIGMDNREFYIYFSALGFIAYLIFRVFRTFFLFRPQKYQ
jgi:hypothetical protein